MEIGGDCTADGSHAICRGVGGSDEDEGEYESSEVDTSREDH
jgi:hypothetical protein